jgi:hypothetical protein
MKKIRKLAAYLLFLENFSPVFAQECVIYVFNSASFVDKWEKKKHVSKKPSQRKTTA